MIRRNLILVFSLWTISTLPVFAQVSLQSGVTNFGAQNVGTSTTNVLIFTFSQSFGLTSAPAVVTQGVVNADFTSPNGTCLPGTYYSTFTCNVQVTFTPQYPGLRMGAVVFFDSNGTAILTTYLQGIGAGPLPNAGTGLNQSSPPLRLGSVAVDAGGTVYLGGYEGSSWGLFLADGTTLATDFSGTNTTVIDGAGTIYTSDQQANCVWKTTAPLPWGNSVTARTTTCWSPTAGVALYGPIAVDGAGNLYLSDYTSGMVLMYTSGGAESTAATCFNTSLNGACQWSGYGAMTVDGLGNLYVFAPGGGSCTVIGSVSVGWWPSCADAILEVPPATGMTPREWTAVWQGSNVLSLALDGEGTLYVLDGAYNLWKVPLASTQALVDTADLGVGNWAPWRMAIDQQGNAWITAPLNATLFEITGLNKVTATAPINGACGTANSQTVTVPPSAATALCSAGTPSVVSGSGPWNWTCAGENNGVSSPLCTANPPTTALNGACISTSGAPTANLCDVGNASAVVGSGPWQWICGGLNGGNAVSCTATASGAVDGLCGTAAGVSFTNAPGASLCAAGTPTTVSGPNSGPWSWTCNGFQGGGPSGTCSTASTACTAGSTSTAEATVTATAVHADDAGHVYMSYSQSQNGFSTGYISTLGGSQVVSDPFLGMWSAYGSGNIDYTSDTVLIENGVRTQCGVIGSAMVANSRGILYFIGARNSRYSPPNILTLSCIPSANESTVVTGAGSGCPGETDELGDGCVGTSATLSNPSALAVDSKDNLYIWDNYLIRRLDALTHVITMVADVSDTCDSDNANSMAVGPDGTIYFADGTNVWRVSAASNTCMIVTLPNLKTPVGVAIDTFGSLYVADAGKSQVVQVTNVAQGNCASQTPVNAACGYATKDTYTNAPKSGLCNSPSTPSPVVNTGSGQWTWVCAGQNYGSSALCATLSACDIDGSGATDVSDVQLIINEALGLANPYDDLNGDGAVDVIEVQIVTNAVLGNNCMGTLPVDDIAVRPAKAVRNARGQSLRKPR